MSRILYIEASPRKDRSHSIHVAKHFLQAYRDYHESDEVEVLDLWHMELPPFDGFTIAAKYAILRGNPHTEQQAQAWKQVTDLFEPFAQADKYVFSIPMWNYSIPYRLKHYIDIITQPGLAFNVTDEGLKGAVTGKPAVLIYSSGGTYNSEKSPVESKDFQKPYMRCWLEFIGFETIKEVIVDNMLAPPDTCKEHEQELFAQTETLAKHI